MGMRIVKEELFKGKEKRKIECLREEKREKVRIEEVREGEARQILLVLL